jgi:hypothetical protein
MFTQKFGEPLSWNVKENDQKTKSLTIFNDNFSNTFQKKKNDIKSTSLDVVICIFRRT